MARIVGPEYQKIVRDYPELFPDQAEEFEIVDKLREDSANRSQEIPFVMELVKDKPASENKITRESMSTASHSESIEIQPMNSESLPQVEDSSSDSTSIKR